MDWSPRTLAELRLRNFRLFRKNPMLILVAKRWGSTVSIQTASNVSGDSRNQPVSVPTIACSTRRVSNASVINRRVVGEVTIGDYHNVFEMPVPESRLIAVQACLEQLTDPQHGFV